MGVEGHLVGVSDGRVQAAGCCTGSRCSDGVRKRQTVLPRGEQGKEEGFQRGLL